MSQEWFQAAYCGFEAGLPASTGLQGTGEQPTGATLLKDDSWEAAESWQADPCSVGIKSGEPQECAWQSYFKEEMMKEGQDCEACLSKYHWHGPMEEKAQGRAPSMSVRVRVWLPIYQEADAW